MNTKYSTILILASILACFFSGVYTSISGDYSAWATFGSIFPLVMVSLAIGHNKEKDPVSPLYILFYLLFISVFGKTVFLLFFDASGVGLYKSLDGRGVEILVPGLIVTNLACFAFVMGYSLCRRFPLIGLRKTTTPDERIYQPSNRINSYRTYLILTSILALSVYSVFEFISTLNIWSDILSGKLSVKRMHQESAGVARRGSALGYVRIMGSVLPQLVVAIMFVHTSIYRISLSTSNKILLVLLGLTSLAIPVISSARISALLFFVVLLMIYHYCVKTLSIRKAAAISVGLLLLLSWFGEMRSSHIQAKENSFLGISKIIEGSYWMDIGKTSVIVNSFPEKLEYLNGSSFLLFVLAPIPRTIWPEKPSVRISYFVGESVYNRPDNAGIPPGFIGESFMNFGHLGVGVCLFLLGALMARIYTRYSNDQRPMVRLYYVYLVIILMFILLTVDFTAAVVQLIIVSLLIYILSKLLVPKISSRAIVNGKYCQTIAGVVD